MSQRNRLHTPHAADFANPVIDTGAPLAFRLDGRRFRACAGDTVLSALIANGVDTVGLHLGHPLALDETSAPPVALRGNTGHPDLAMPMALCPVADGMDIVTCAPKKARTRLGRLFDRMRGGSTSLNLDLSQGLAPSKPWLAGAPHVHDAVDIVVVGGGLAGMAAARRAHERGMRVALVDRGPRLGGLAEYFGKVEGEATPRDMTGALVGDLAGHEGVTIFSHTEAFDIADGHVHAIRVVVENGIPRPQRIAIEARHIVLATGAEERLPIFPGNRLPGVLGSAFAWRMAAHYGVWRGQSVHVHTSANAGYRLALTGADCGKTINRTSDPRSHPQTRFIEFSKAYGFPLGWGIRLDAVSAREGALTIRHADTETGRTNTDPITADTLIVSGGWQPDLALWLRAGGGIAWDDNRQCAVPKGEVPGLALAGAMAGYVSQTGCVQSGEAAADQLILGHTHDISDPQIDPIYETPDGPYTVAPPARRGLPPAYLAPGATLNALAEPARTGLSAMFVKGAPQRSAIADLALSPREAAGAIRAGLVPADAVETLFGERVILPQGFPVPKGPEPTDPEANGIPGYLNARFGSRQALWNLSPDTDRNFGPGCLVFVDSSATDPAMAIGVIVSHASAKPQALLAAGQLKRGETAFIRDGVTAVRATLETRVQAD